MTTTTSSGLAAIRARLMPALSDRLPAHIARLDWRPEELAESQCTSLRSLLHRAADVVTDRRVTRALVERHVTESATEPPLILGDYICLASGGSSGLRGIYVQTPEEYAEFVRARARNSAAGAAAVVAAAMTTASRGGGCPPAPRARAPGGSGTASSRRVPRPRTRRCTRTPRRSRGVFVAPSVFPRNAEAHPSRSAAVATIAAAVAPCTP